MTYHHRHGARHEHPYWSAERTPSNDPVHDFVHSREVPVHVGRADTLMDDLPGCRALAARRVDADSSFVGTSATCLDPAGGVVRYHGRTMDAKLSAELDRFRDALAERFGDGLVSLVAFGSRIRGTPHAESDLDLLLVASGLPRRRLDRHGLIAGVARGISSDFAATISVIPLFPEEASAVKPFYLGLLDGHRILVDRDGFIAKILERLQARLAELGARRLTDELGNEYWDLKPDYVLGEDVRL